MAVSNFPDDSRSVEVPPLLPPERSFCLGRTPGLFHHPLVIFGWQLAACALAWSFIIVLSRRGEITLSDTVAELINRYPSETTLIATLISTVLSAATTWFFHAAIKQAVVPFLSRPVSLFYLCSAMEFSMGSAVLNKYHVRWTASTVLCVALLGTLTSAWSSIISPITINILLQVTGQELDVSTLAWMNTSSVFSPDTLQSPQAESNGLLMDEPRTSDLPYDGGLGNAGVSAIVGGIGYESIISTTTGAYNVSTGGLIPISNPLLSGIGGWGSSAYGPAYPHITPLDGIHFRGLSSNQTLYQQGFTANVSCRPQNFSDPTTFPYTVLSNSTFSLGAGSTYSITSWSWNTTCSDNVFSLTTNVFTLDNPLGGSNSSFLAGSVCPLQSFSGPSNQSFLIAFQAFYLPAYSFSQLCEVTPLLTTVQASYGGGIINVQKILNSSTFDQIDPRGLMVNGLSHVIGGQIYAAQALNIVGNALLNNINDFVTGLPIVLAELNWEHIFEDYWRGLVEATITSFRLSTFVVFADTNITEIPQNMSLPVGGIIQVTTKGWRFNILGNMVALLPITATLLLSIIALLLPRVLRHRTRSPPNSAVEGIIFDPASIMSIIRASAAGGLSHSLRGLRGVPESNENREARSLFIGLTQDNKIGFVESETTYVPITDTEGNNTNPAKMV